MDSWPLPATALVAVLAMTTLAWLGSLAKRDASIVDMFWGLGFVVAGGIYFGMSERETSRGALVFALVTLCSPVSGWAW
jgi:steroid 5-alpha reductase family enzyme